MTSDKKIRILLVDDHIVLRMGLATAASGEADMEVVGEAENGTDAIAAYRELRPDVVVMDLRMPHKGGLETAAEILAHDRSAKILVFSNYAGADEIMRAFQAGILGVVIKQMPLDSLLEGIRAVDRREKFIPTEISERISKRAISQLSPRELEILGLIASGMSNKTIASHLGLVEGTVKLHVTKILSKLGVTDRTQAILTAIKQGIITIE